jgi:FkbM family methyltransferase
MLKRLWSRSGFRIELTSHPRGTVPLGQSIAIRATGHGGPVEYYVTYNGVMGTEPIEAKDDTLALFPEAPGAYVISARAGRDDETAQWSRVAFEVSGDSPMRQTPELVNLDETTRVWAGNEWGALLARNYESEVMQQLPSLIRPGAVVYDVGSNIGLYALRFAKLAGARGHVYCVEANPLCNYFLCANMAENRLTNYTVLPVAASDHDTLIEFSINLGNFAVGIDHDSSFFGGKPGARISVPARTLDGLIAHLRLPPPSVLKMDIEGAEASAIRGLARTIAAHRPSLILELHGRAAACETLSQLESAGYRYVEVKSGRSFATARDVQDWCADEVFQVIATQP